MMSRYLDPPAPLQDERQRYATLEAHTQEQQHALRALGALSCMTCCDSFAHITAQRMKSVTCGRRSRKRSGLSVTSRSAPTTPRSFLAVIASSHVTPPQARVRQLQSTVHGLEDALDAEKRAHNATKRAAAS